jgi:hypothetical protein
VASSWNIIAPPSKEFYQLKVYHLSSEQQEKTVESFLEKAYLPALHRAGLKAGIFKPVAGDATAGKEKLIYVFIPFRSYDQFAKLERQLEKDQQYLSDGKEYHDAPYTAPPYDRIETILMTAFEKSPRSQMPSLSSPKKDRIYELRSYEGHTEKLSRNKIQMFNMGDEVGIFKRLGFNAVFYGEVFAGSRMPNLIYMTTFENKTERDAHWQAFQKDTVWKRVSALPEYQHNVSKNVTSLLYPAEYSDY